MRYQNEHVTTVGDHDRHYRCGGPDCDQTVLPVPGEPHVRHTEYGRDTMRRTLYCSDACLSDALEGNDE